MHSSLIAALSVAGAVAGLALPAAAAPAAPTGLSALPPPCGAADREAGLTAGDAEAAALAALKPRAPGATVRVIALDQPSRTAQACSVTYQASTSVSGPEACAWTQVAAPDHTGKIRNYSAWVCDPQDLEVQLR